MTVAEGDDRTVVVPMTPPGRARFRVVTDLDGSARTSAFVSVGVDGYRQSGGVLYTADADGYITVSVPPRAAGTANRHHGSLVKATGQSSGTKVIG